MKIEDLQKYMSPNDGCPCGDFKKRGFHLSYHCWRVDLDCLYSAVHIEKYPKGKLKEAKEIAKVIADDIAESYMTRCDVVVSPRK